jgi:uncharacterized membrane protein YraQ (UPF0718 family)
MEILIGLTAVLVTVSFIKDRKKTFKAIKKGINRMMIILFPLLAVLIIVSFVLYFIPEKTITEYLTGGNKYTGTLIALLLGSISVMPGFIAFPLSGILKDNGVLFMIIAAFTTSLMMVGIISFPVEKKYFGTKVALLRNIISFLTAAIVSIAAGILYGEILL